ncbi:hypothetical protein [Nocardiopsis sp. NRRL B-16309]|uniref:hypothetical protein n=1 Tax=Nocardiopsis sp. NRRL B-16309 TaxID=1519494 RepID=UPI0006AE6511|nr:hypothetical protein [Nocardiopsis sp. NRRL B-16309]KOX18054.1 hypothetical protein ADL05_08035 [Nocardiopsis sp. NRRL B-16309]
MNWVHRSCIEQIRARESEVREDQREMYRLTGEGMRLRAERDEAVSARWDAAGEAEVLRDPVTVLEKELAERRHADSEPARRRARAAWRTLWRVPAISWHPSAQEYEAEQATRAAAAQAILAMPLNLFAGELTYRGGSYYLDSTPLHLPGPDPYGCGPDKEALLQDRYGLTREEISAAMDEDRERRANAA